MTNKRSFLQTLAAVGWSFIGLRRKRDFDVDAEGAIDPVHMLIATLVGVTLFIGLLLLAVRLAVSAS